MKITITKDEHAAIMLLYTEAKNTPVLIMPGNNGPTQTAAATKLKSNLEMVADKYGYDPASANIPSDSYSFEATPSGDFVGKLAWFAAQIMAKLTEREPMPKWLVDTMQLAELLTKVDEAEADDGAEVRRCEITTRGAVLMSQFNTTHD